MSVICYYCIVICNLIVCIYLGRVLYSCHTANRLQTVYEGQYTMSDVKITICLALYVVFILGSLVAAWALHVGQRKVNSVQLALCIIGTDNVQGTNCTHKYKYVCMYMLTIKKIMNLLLTAKIALKVHDILYIHCTEGTTASCNLCISSIQ
jgi:hypothetical protein